MTQNNDHINLPRLLSKKEIAAILGYTTRTIDRLIAAKRIPYLTIPSASGCGKRIKFDPREIDRWIKGYRAGATVEQTDSVEHAEDSTTNEAPVTNARALAMQILSQGNTGRGRK